MQRKDTVFFSEDKLPYKVIAANERYAVLTRKLNKRQDADLLHFEVTRGASRSFMEAYNSLKDDPVYTIVDNEQNIRGTENLIFGLGFHTEEKCQQAIERLATGETEISHRNRIALSVTKIITHHSKTN